VSEFSTSHCEREHQYQTAPSALSRLTTERNAERIFYLYGAGENYWLSPIASLNQEAEDRAKTLSAAEVEAEIITPDQGRGEAQRYGLPARAWRTGRPTRHRGRI
jgi:hypothetical protein